ncbi:MAG: acyl-CoA reductase [Bacteroidetes bacterium 4572_117]|nr:MAG: acyl-CoA reductase [Bacteroidetes bacterium 4572_117]
MRLNSRIIAFNELGKQLANSLKKESDQISVAKFKSVTKQVSGLNEWFTENNLKNAINTIAKSLTEQNINTWLNSYPKLPAYKTEKKVAIIMAGNIPLVGFHDLLCVLIAGHKAIVKLSSKDDTLIKGVVELLVSIEPGFKDMVSFTDDRLKSFDAVIATGSTNSSRYFEYYFGKYPNIIRKNRNSIAVITGNETDEELKLLADDIFLYFGLGCRNVSKLFIHDNFDIDRFFKAMYHYKDLINHNKYANNYTYNRSVYLMNKVDFLENGFLILKEDLGMSSPISAIFYERYSDLKTVKERLAFDKENIQCVVSNVKELPNQVGFGIAQKPQLWDYADNVDTLEFLLSL